MNNKVNEIQVNGKHQFPTTAGIFLGLGLGGFFDGIILHQVLQWHHMVSNIHPPTTVPALEMNTLWDGLFHSLTYIFVVIGLALLWRDARRTHTRWSGKLLVGTLLLGFGLFNLVEGTINHLVLGLHHVNETVPANQWIYWDIGFLVWGALMVAGGLALLQAGRNQSLT